MRALAAIALLLAAVACTSTAPPTPGATPRPVPTKAAITAVPLGLPGLDTGSIVTVLAGELAQVADPNRPHDGAFQSPLHPGERSLRTLGQSARVLIVGGPTNPNGDVYWRVADDPFPGCCAPFGWIRESQAGDQPAIAPAVVDCPDQSAVIDGNRVLALGVMETASCFRALDFKLSGEVRCSRPAVDSFVSITGPAWAHDQTLCILDNAVPVYGPAVTALYDPAQDGFDGTVALTAHFNDPTSNDCRWGPGSFMSIDVSDAPVDTAQFACRMSLYVTHATASQESPVP